MTIRILLAENHSILRTGMQNLIERQTDMEIVGQATNGREAVKLAAELKPDVIILDISMPDINGLDAA